MIALSHPALAAVLMVCALMAAAGAGLVLWALWCLLSICLDWTMERWTRWRTRNRRVNTVRIYLAPSTRVERSAYYADRPGAMK